MMRKQCSQLLFNGRLPGQLVVQLTDRCNATCPQCGMNITQRYTRHTLEADDVKQIIDAAAARGVQAISFTGGEPLLTGPTLLTSIRHAGAAGIPYIRTGTNGFVFRGSEKHDFADRIHRFAEALAATPLRNFWISIDSADPQTHEAMRGFPGVIRGIARAIPIFHEHGLFPSANLGLNRNLAGGDGLPGLAPSPAGDNRAAQVFRRRLYQGLSRFFRFVEELGFTIANVCYPMSIDANQDAMSLNAVYGATATSAIVSFTAQEKAYLFEMLGRAVLENRSRLRIFTPLSALYELRRQFRDGAQGYSCRGGHDFFFIDAVKGHTFPCGFRGDEDSGPYRRTKPLRQQTARDCRACEWECFRDPSTLGGPALDLVRSPHRLWQRYREDRAFFFWWLKDLGYYRACDFFDGRRPMRRRRLQTQHEAFCGGTLRWILQS
jgi:hypothetical protein